METKMPTNMTPLSATRIKTLENCSWLYWSTYHLKLPSVQNDGAKKGEVCHSVFEILLNQRHLKHYKRILKADSIAGSKALERLVRLYLKKLNITGNQTDVFAQIDRMILVGLKADFFGQGGTVVKPEYKFEIFNPDPRYLIKGFIDKPILKKEEIIIDDFKSSKKKFSGEDHESNMQGLLYSLAAKKLWPMHHPRVRFIFLQYPQEPMQKIEFTNDALLGFEHYLAEMQRRVDEFNIVDAKGAYAADQTAAAGEFKGKLLCGFAKQAGQLKKDGTPMWHCPYKFPFTYWLVKNKSGAPSRSYFKKEEVTLKEGETVQEMQYKGCPKYFPTSVLDNLFNRTPKKVLDYF